MAYCRKVVEKKQSYRFKDSNDNICIIRIVFKFIRGKA